MKRYTSAQRVIEFLRMFMTCDMYINMKACQPISYN